MSRLKVYDLATATWIYVGGVEPVSVGTSAPPSPSDGKLWWDTDDDSVLPLTFDPNTLAVDAAFSSRYVPQVSTWVTSFVPTIWQGAGTPNIAKTVRKSQWHYDGDMIEWECDLAITGPGTAGNALSITVPITLLSGSTFLGGSAIVFDSSLSTRSVCSVAGANATNINFLNDTTATSWDYTAWGVVPNVALASGDVVTFAVRYRWR